MLLPRFASLILALALAGLPGYAPAAELGEPVLRSYIGQPLVADIELGSLADPAVPVVVRIAHADVFRAANIAKHPLLASLNLSVMRRDGRQFLHITSTKPLESELLHLFLELNEGTQRNVRAVTLWLQPDPDPAPPPPPPPVAKPAETPDQVLEAAVARAARAKPVLPVCQAQAPIAPKYSADQIKACAAMDYKNGLLSAQIVELEEKVKLLQAAIEGRAKMPAPLPAASAPAAPATKPVPPPPAKPAPAKKKEGLPWLLIGAGVAGLAALGGGLFFFLRRRKGKDATAEGAASASAAWYARLGELFKRKPKPEAEPAVEPAAE